MSFRRWFFLLLGLAGLALFAHGLRGYVGAWSAHGGDAERTMAAGRSAMRALPGAAFGVLLMVAAAFGWWRDPNR